MINLGKKDKNIILVIVSILIIITLFNLDNISDALGDKKVKKEKYDERYAVMLKADSKDLDSLSSGISSFRWYVRDYSPDRKMVKKFQNIVADYYNHEEVKNLDIQSSLDAQSMRNFYADFSYINETKQYLPQEKNYKYLDEEQIDKMEQLVLAREEKEEREQQRELEIERGFTDKDVYYYMRNAYNEITNYGENYKIDIHDEQVATMASEKFGISSTKAGEIYVKIEMQQYNTNKE